MLVNMGWLNHFKASSVKVYNSKMVIYYFLMYSLCFWGGWGVGKMEDGSIQTDSVILKCGQSPYLHTDLRGLLSQP